jgi:deoxyribonuclease V
MESWPSTTGALIEAQEALAAATPPPWKAPGDPAVAGCFVCFPRGLTGEGAPGDPAWAAAALGDAVAVHAGRAAAPYEPGLLALREGPLLEAAVRALPRLPDVLLVNATGRDHPRRAGLALHLGAVLDVPSIGVTHRPLVASGEWPEDRRGAHSPLTLDGEVVGVWLRTRRGRRPLAVTPGWRTAVDATSLQTVLTECRVRAPEPLRAARRAARRARVRTQTPER